MSKVLARDLHNIIQGKSYSTLTLEKAKLYTEDPAQIIAIRRFLRGTNGAADRWCLDELVDQIFSR